MDCSRDMKQGHLLALADGIVSVSYSCSHASFAIIGTKLAPLEVAEKGARLFLRRLLTAGRLNVILD